MCAATGVCGKEHNFEDESSSPELFQKAVLDAVVDVQSKTVLNQASPVGMGTRQFSGKGVGIGKLRKSSRPVSVSAACQSEYA